MLQLNSQVTDLFGNVIVKRINIRLFDLLARCHYILNLLCMPIIILPSMHLLLSRLYSFYCLLIKVHVPKIE